MKIIIIVSFLAMNVVFGGEINWFRPASSQSGYIEYSEDIVKVTKSSVTVTYEKKWNEGFYQQILSALNKSLNTTMAGAGAYYPSYDIKIIYDTNLKITSILIRLSS